MRLFPILKKTKNENGIQFFEVEQDTPDRSYLKLMALETVIGFIARTIATSEFKVVENGKNLQNFEFYKFNVKPNTDQSSYSFWWEVTYRLIFDGHVLVVPSDTGDMLIADSFYRKEFALYEDIFEDVTIKDYTYQRSFPMNEVFYLEFGNEKLQDFTHGMFKDYTSLFNRMIENNMRSNQIRGTVALETSTALEGKKKEQLQTFINGLYKSFKDRAVAIVPQLKGFEYNEISDGKTSSQTIDEMTKLKSSLVDEVADILGVPQKLIHGDIADIESLMTAYIKFCIDPIVKMISDELNAKFISMEDYLKGKRIKIISIQALSILDNATSIDKLISSGAFTRNEVREMVGKDRVDDPELDKFLVTKNYTQTVEGGENKDEKA